MSQVSVLTSNEFYLFHCISSGDVIRHGWEKACIIGNIERINHFFERPDWHNGFPYIPKERFETLVSELIEDNILQTNEEVAQ